MFKNQLLNHNNFNNELSYNNFISFVIFTICDDVFFCTFKEELDPVLLNYSNLAFDVKVHRARV